MTTTHPLPALDCKRCGNPFQTRRAGQVYCTRLCRLATGRERYRLENAPATIATATTGALSELIVAADLMRRGYSVFRALSPACDCDLAVLKEGRLLRIEVRTGRRSPAGALMVPRGDPTKYDILAICRPSAVDGFIEYEPALP